MADGINSLAYGHHTIPAKIHPVVQLDEPVDKIISAAAKTPLTITQTNSADVYARIMDEVELPSDEDDED